MTFVSHTHQIELLLKRKQLLTLQEAQPGMAIECRQGVVWVTATGDLNDHPLSPGERYQPRAKGRVVIEALDDACVDIID